MINYSLIDLFKQDSVTKDLIITDGNNVNLSNSDIYSESFELTEILCSENELVFGSCNATCLKFTTSYLGELKGKTMTVKVVLNNNTGTPFQFGKYKVFEDKLTADRTKKEVVAYDALYDIINANVIDWYNTLLPNATSHKTLKQFRDSFFSHFGITQETTTLDNDSIAIYKTVSGELLSGADVIRAICVTNGCFGRINRSGKFEYTYLKPIGTGLFPSLTLYPSTTLYPSRHKDSTPIGENGKYISAKYEDYQVEQIDRLIIRTSENDVGLDYHNTGTNPYIIENDFLLYGKSSAQLTPIASNIFNRISGIYYTPCEIELQGNPCYEIGDGIYLDLVNGDEIVTYILSRTYKGIHSQKDHFVADGLKHREQNVNSVGSQLIQLRGKSNVLERTIEETKSTITDEILDPNNPLSLQSQVTQNATAISAKVSKTSPAGQTSFSWEMTDSKMEWKQNNNQIMLLNSSGLKITGEVNASSGKIGNWDITSGSISHEYTNGETHTKIVLQADGTIVCYDLNNNNAVKWALQCDGDVQFAGNANIAGYTKTTTLVSTYATINSLNAVDAKFTNLNADNITAGTLSVSRLNIDGIVQSMSTKNLTVQALTATGVVILGGKMCYWQDDGDGYVLHGSAE